MNNGFTILREVLNYWHVRFALIEYSKYLAIFRRDSFRFHMYSFTLFVVVAGFYWPSNLNLVSVILIDAWQFPYKIMEFFIPGLLNPKLFWSLLVNELLLDTTPHDARSLTTSAMLNELWWKRTTNSIDPIFLHKLNLRILLVLFYIKLSNMGKLSKKSQGHNDDGFAELIENENEEQGNEVVEEKEDK